MCGGARYIDNNGKDWKIYFPNPKATLPVWRKNEVEWVKWGHRREQNPRVFVPGGWARYESILEGKWERYTPETVQLAVISFMEKDAHRGSHWIDVPAGMAIEGLITRFEDQERLYVVTEETPLEYSWVHDRWPRLVIREEDARLDSM